MNEIDDPKGDTMPRTHPPVLRAIIRLYRDADHASRRVLELRTGMKLTD